MFMRGVFLAGACIVFVATVLIGSAYWVIGEGLTLIFACGLIVWIILTLICTRIIFCRISGLYFC